MSAYVEAKRADAQRRRADLLAQAELAERAGCKSMAEMAEFLNRSGFRNADGGPWNAHSFQTSLARLRASTPGAAEESTSGTAEERPGTDVARP
jgi:recombinase-like protein